MKNIIAKRLSIIIFLVSTFSFSQNSNLNKLFIAFDTNNNQDVIQILESIDETTLSHITPNDSIQFSIYKIIKLKFTDYTILRSDQNLQRQYKFELKYLLSKNLGDFLPYFLNYYSNVYSYDAKYYKECLEFINLSIKIEKKGLNKSHRMSVLNLFDAYDIKHVLNLRYNNAYKGENIKELIMLYEKNTNQLNLTNVTLFKRYYSASVQTELNNDFRFSAFEKAFYHLKMMETPIKFPKPRDLLFSLRVLSEKTNNYELLKTINKKYKDKITTIDFLINACYINEIDINSFRELENHVTLKMDSKAKLNKDDILDLKLIINKASIKVAKDILKTNKEQIDLNYWQDVYKLAYRFNKKFGTSQNKLHTINNILNFKTNYLSLEDKDNEVFDLVSLKNEKQNLLYDIIKNNNSVGISPYDFIDLYKLRTSLIYYPNWTEKEIENDLYDLFDSYKNTVSYQDFVETLSLYWQFVYSMKNYKLEGLDIEVLLDKSKDFINKELKTIATDQDLDIRILISDHDELDSLKIKFGELYNKSIINEQRFKQLNLKILESKFNNNVKYSKENAFEYYKFLIDNINEKDFEPSIFIAMGLAVDNKFNYKLVKLSNYLLKNYDKYFVNQPDADRYSFQIMAGYYYKYIQRDDKALMLFLNARANSYHWNSGLLDYASLTKENILLYQIFDIYINKKDIEKSKEYLILYLEAYEHLLKAYGNTASKIVKIDTNMFIEIERESLDMKRRLFFIEKKHKENEAVIDSMLIMENKKPFYGKFNLSIQKLRSQVSQNKFSNKQHIYKLDSIYLYYKKPLDKKYYDLKYSFGKFEPEFISFQIENFESKLSNIALINELSYENQINMMLRIGISLSQLEKYVLNNLSDKENLKFLSNFKLKVDELDRYNTQLLNLDQSNTDIYFELLNKRYYERDYDKLELVKNEFDIFQQEKKINFEKHIEIDLVSFQNRLSEQQAYIRFSKLKSNIFYAYIISKKNIEVIKMPDIDFEKIANFYSSRITKLLNDSYTYEKLFKPIVDQLPENINELFIKNEGVYNNINIEALWVPESETYIFDKYKINYVERPSAIFTINDTITINTAFLFGNPDFSIDGNLLEDETTGVRAGINPLPYTAKEIKELNLILNNNNIKTVTTNLSTSTEQSLYDNSKSNIIHIATHGFYNEGKKTDRYNWGLLATGSKNTILNDFKKEPRNDGIIFGMEIILKNFTQTELVVLSACETGYGTTTFFGGENLANSFLRAGAKNIISTLWPVDDQITQKFMKVFYNELVKNKNINLALRKTKIIIKEQYKEPNYWAPFVLIQNKI